MFIDKYTQVPRILNPLVLVLGELPGMCRDPAILQYVEGCFGSVEECRCVLGGSGEKGGVLGGRCAVEAGASAGVVPIGRSVLGVEGLYQVRAHAHPLLGFAYAGCFNALQSASPRGVQDPGPPPRPPGREAELARSAEH